MADVIRLASEGRRLEMELALGSMARLRPSLHNATGMAHGVLQFGVDEQGAHFVEGEVHAELTVTCQRCLQPMPVIIERRFRLAMVNSDEAAERLPASYEPLLLRNRQADLSDLIEDELLLALPFAPRHAPEACTAGLWMGPTYAAAQETSGPRHPFGALAAWKRDTGDRTETN